MWRKWIWSRGRSRVKGQCALFCQQPGTKLHLSTHMFTCGRPEQHAALRFVVISVKKTFCTRTQETGCFFFLLKCCSICFGLKAAFVLPGVYGLIKWSVILMVFTHFIFIICCVLILNANCYACSNTLNVAKNFADWDKYVCVCMCVEASIERRVNRDRHTDEVQIGRWSAAGRNSCQITVSLWIRSILWT